MRRPKVAECLAAKRRTVPEVLGGQQAVRIANAAGEADHAAFWLGPSGGWFIHLRRSSFGEV